MSNNTKTSDLRERAAATYMKPWFEQVTSGEHSQVTTFTLKEAQIDAVVELVNQEVRAALDNLKEPTINDVFPDKPYDGTNTHSDMVKVIDYYKTKIVKERANYE
jgi:hypothetical protein